MTGDHGETSPSGEEQINTPVTPSPTPASAGYGDGDSPDSDPTFHSATSQQSPASSHEKTIGDMAFDQDTVKLSTTGISNALPPAISFTPATPTPTPKPQHLETYILCPRFETTGDTVTWSTKIQQIHLDESTMQVQLDNLDPSYSITSTLSALPPAQIWAVQEHVRSREGYLVHIQLGVPADMVTPMGTFQVKTVVFMIRTAAVLPVVDHEATLHKDGSELRRERQTPSAVSTSGVSRRVLTPATAAARATASARRRDAGSLREYRGSPQNLAESEYQYRPDFFHEENPGCGSVERFMTITASRPLPQYGNDISLEELRVSDYAAGLRYASVTLGASYFGGQFGRVENSSRVNAFTSSPTAEAIAGVEKLNLGQVDGKTLDKTEPTTTTKNAAPKQTTFTVPTPQLTQKAVDSSPSSQDKFTPNVHYTPSATTQPPSPPPSQRRSSSTPHHDHRRTTLPRTPNIPTSPPSTTTTAPSIYEINPLLAKPARVSSGLGPWPATSSTSNSSSTLGSKEEESTFTFRSPPVARSTPIDGTAPTGSWEPGKAWKVGDGQGKKSRAKFIADGEGRIWDRYVGSM